jgi:hypothetical protein
MRAQASPRPTEGDIEADVALAWQDGDPRAIIATLFDDFRHLRRQLALMGAAMSAGMTRGWKPSFERPE